MALRSIRVKIMLIGSLSSLLLMILALVTSYLLYYKGTKNEYLNNIDSVIDQMRYDLNEDNYAKDVKRVKEYILDNYTTEIPKFNDQVEERDFYRNHYSQLYPATNGMMGFSQITGQYTNVLSFLKSASIASNSRVYLCITDWDKNEIIYLSDSLDDDDNLYYYSGKSYDFTRRLEFKKGEIGCSIDTLYKISVVLNTRIDKFFE